jgi:D-3-phosphoglycerate dehydrogenase / 2-oxoglutarate reductase
VRIVQVFMGTGSVPNVVNIAKTTPATHKLIVRHRDRPGVLAHVFDALKLADINVQETENIVFDGAQAAVAQINVDSPLPEAVLQQIRTGCPDIIAVTMLAR